MASTFGSEEMVNAHSTMKLRKGMFEVEHPAF